MEQVQKKFPDVFALHRKKIDDLFPNDQISAEVGDLTGLGSGSWAWAQIESLSTRNKPGLNFPTDSNPLVSFSRLAELNL